MPLGNWIINQMAKGNLRYGLIIVGLTFCWSANADNQQRNVAGKLTAPHKPHVRVMTDKERAAASENMLALDLDVNPDEIVCKKVKVGRDSASRLMVNRCRTRAEFREEAEQQLLALGLVVDKFNLTQEFYNLGGLQNHRPISSSKPSK